MEVETRPPLVDGKLGFHSSRKGSDLRLAIAHHDILSDDEQELLKSPVDERLQPASSILNGAIADASDDISLEDPSEKCTVEPKCNGFELVVGNDAFRTESEKRASTGDSCEREESFSSHTENAGSAEDDGSRENDVDDVGTNRVSDDVGATNVSDDNDIAPAVDQAVDQCEIDGLDGPEIVFDSSGDIKLAVDDLGTADDSKSEPQNEDAEDEVGEPTVVSVTCLGEDDVGDCPVVVAATSLPVEESENLPVEESENEKLLDGEAEDAGEGLSDAETVDRNPSLHEDDYETANDIDAEEDASEPPAENLLEPADELVNEAEPADELVNEAEPADELVNEAEPVDELLNEAEPADELVNEAEPADELLNEAEPADELVNEAEPADDDGMDTSEAVGDGGDGEEFGDGSAEGPAERIGIAATAEVSMDVDGNVEDADEEMDVADTEVDDDQGEEEGSPEYQGMTEDILPIIESELDADLDGQPEGVGSYDTEFERPDDENGCLDDENGISDEVIADDVSIHESEDSRMAADASPHESDDSRAAGDGSIHESEDSRSGVEPPQASDDSRPASESSDQESKRPEANVVALESECSKPDNESARESENSKPVESTEGKSEETTPESSAAKDLPEVTEGLLEKLLRERKPAKRRASVDALLDSPPKKIKRQSSVDGLTEDGFDSQKSLSEFKRLKEEQKPLPKEEIPGSPQLESKPEVDDKIRIPVDVGAGASKELVIDLDEDEEKKELLKQEDAKEEKTDTKVPLVEAPVRRTGVDCALDALFNGKDEITLSRKTFTKIMKSYVSQYMTTYSSFGKQGMRTALKAEDTLNKVGSNVSAYEKQKEELKMVMKKLLDDREASKQWDPSLVPPKTTRSVGLQVCTVGSIYVPKNCEAVDPSTRRVGTLPNPTNAMMQQKMAYAQQQQAMAASRAQNANRPTAKKSTTTTTTTTQVGRPAMNRMPPVSTPSRPVGQMTKTTVPGQFQQLNGVKTSVRKTPDPLAFTRPPNATLSPNGKTFLIGAKKVNVSPTKTSPGQIRTTINPALTRALGTALSTPVPSPGKTQPMGQTPNRNAASGPGRPLNRTPIAKTPATIPLSPAVTPQMAKKTTTPGTPVEATIDLTDDDGPQTTKATPTSAPNARKSTVPAKILPAPALKQMRHPALPPNPPNFNALTAPPKPYLGICDTQQGTQGIMLTWHFNQVHPLRKVSKFQVFAYQESKSGAEDAWKKVGDVDALPLPMACTLTQFREGYTYHFIVRAIDDIGNVGPFSAPNTITLMKKT